MKRIIAILLAMVALLALVACVGTNSSGLKHYVVTEPVVTEPVVTEPVKHYLSNQQVINAFMMLRHEYAIWSMSYNDLIPRLIDSYQIKVFNPDDTKTTEKTKALHFEVENEDNVYCIIVSGEVAINPDISYYTDHYDEAIIAVVEFDDTGTMINASVATCNALTTASAIMFSNGY